MTSPCIGICQMDEDSGYCIGCGRTIEEISGWSSASPEQKQETLTQLPERKPAGSAVPEAGNGQ